MSEVSDLAIPFQFPQRDEGSVSCHRFFLCDFRRLQHA
jgi:hypothetical protein